MLTLEWVSDEKATLRLESDAGGIHLRRPGWPGFGIAPAEAEAAEALARLTGQCGDLPATAPQVGPGSEIVTLADGALALWAARRWPCLVGPEGAPFHVVLSHAFPLAFVGGMFAHALRHLPVIVRGRQLSLLGARQLVFAETPAAGLEGARRRHARALRRNARLSRQSRPASSEALSALLRDWAEFTSWRFNSPLDAGRLEALGIIFACEGFTVNEFWDGARCVARSLTYVDVAQRALFDVMAPWQRDQARARLGIYTAVLNLLEAGQRGLRYCLCYGIFPYKDEVVRGLPPASFAQW
jgi:hypothetical protein